MCSAASFVETAPGPPEHEKSCVDFLLPGRARMHYMTRRSGWMQKPKFSVTCPGMLFVVSAPSPLEHEK
jgi:hypothetical protein